VTRGISVASATEIRPDGSLRDFDRGLTRLYLDRPTHLPSDPISPDVLSSLDVENPRVDTDSLTLGAWGDLRNEALPHLSVLLPALNEEGGVRRVLKEIPKTSLSRMGFDVSVKLLDGGSTDRTRRVARRHGAEVFVQKGWGKGSAFREFLPSLHSDFCVILDSDATYPPAAIPTFAETLRQGAPVVLGSRFRGKIEDGAMTRANRIGNRLLSLFATFLYRTPVSDVCSGMWGFRTEVLKSLEISADGFDMEANLFAQCALRSIPILEVPIPYYRRIGTAKLRVRTGLRIAWALFMDRIREPPHAKALPTYWDLFAELARKD
jgi:dolichol-phosphate mannosyltransferase